MSTRPPGRGSRPGAGRSGGGAHARTTRPATADRPRPRHTAAESRRPAQPPARRARPVILLAVILLAAVALVVGRQIHTGKSGTAVVAKKAAPVHFSVGITRCTFIDQTRKTKNYGTGALTPGRTLVTEIRYPTISPTPGAVESSGANPARRHGPFPLVIFAHGYDLTPDTYKNLLDVWVKAGFVVAAPLFPDTNANAVDALGKIYPPEADDANQPGDVAFVVKSALADRTAPSSGCSVLHGLIAPGGAAITGQSDGAVTVDALAYAAAYQVPGTPIKAVISLSGEKYAAPNGDATPYASVNGGPPLLVTQSATDTCNPPQLSAAFYSSIVQNQRWFLEINHANHLPPYTGALPAQRSAFMVVSSVTTTFLKDVFSGKAITHKFLVQGNLHPAVAHLTTGPVPTLPSLDMASASCYVN